MSSSLHGLRWRTREAIKSVDVFRQPMRDVLNEGTHLGALLTCIASVICSVLFLVQLDAFLRLDKTTRLAIDSDESALLRINFDITMLDLACDHASLGVFDAYGNSRENVTRNVWKQSVSSEQGEQGHPYTEDELTELEYVDQPSLSDEERAELDADWLSVAGHFRQDDFRSALEAHDFVFVFFCIADFGPCRILLKPWMHFASDVNEGRTVMKDADGADANIRALQVNCAPDAFGKVCEEQGIQGFPRIRLYPRSVAKEPPHVDVSIPLPAPIVMMSMAGVKVEMSNETEKHMYDMLVDHSQKLVAKRHLHTKVGHHAIFAESCRLTGHLDVPRVPGTLHFEARSATDHKLNYAFTNVSHRVNHLSFGINDEMSVAVPDEYGFQARPLDDQAFVSTKFHQAAHHHIKVIHTRREYERGRSVYLMTHQWHLRTTPRHEPPKARLSYDLAPVEVIVSHSRRWYDFATSTLGIVGGAFSSLSMVYGGISAMRAYLATPMGKVTSA
eukprot:TRINITY_DN49105_c0_g1_i1.p1 TRINITY_DN49105_c0_g1~~TRINITY_DN49105_c0_g1_i1.p1  ORF type:complete len:503 (-),score=61.58 TRINITY_DN49105_c0_g1_i1:108-1616(-)